jgi:hypothetical protein
MGTKFSILLEVILFPLQRRLLPQLWSDEELNKLTLLKSNHLSHASKTKDHLLQILLSDSRFRKDSPID